jgi:hypothetical protein
MMWNGGWHGWFFGPIMMIVFIAIAAVVIMFLVRWLGAPGHGAALHHPPGKTPLWLQADSLGPRLESLLYPRKQTSVAEQKKAPTEAGALGGGSDFDPTRSFRKRVQLAGAE